MPGVTTSQREVLNDGSADFARPAAVNKLNRFGDQFFGVVNKTISQSSSQFINLPDFTMSSTDTRSLPGARPGGVVRTLGGTAPNLYVIGESPCPDAPIAVGVATDFTGAANGTFQLTGRAVNNPAPLRVALINAGISQTLRLYSMVDNGAAEFWIIAGTDGGGTITSLASAVIALWNADLIASQYAVAALKTGNDGTGLVLEHIKDAASIPALGHNTAGPPLRRSPGYALSSYDGTRLWLAEAVTGAVLCYTPAASQYPDATFPAPATR